MNLRFIFASIAIASSVATVATAAETRYEREIRDTFNAARADANLRELAIYGTVIEWREPLTHDAALRGAAELWLYLLPKNELAHSAPVESLTDPMLGDLIDTSRDGWVTSSERRAWCGYVGQGAELAALATFANKGSQVAAAWIRSGYADDPRQAQGHYRELIDPRFRELGAASGAGAAGKRRAFCELGEGVP